jgi:putative ABC transport system permease protein
MNLAGRNLLQDRTRLLLSVAGVALAIMMILILTGFVSGMSLKVSTYLDQAPGSVVLVQAGTQGAS